MKPAAVNHPRQPRMSTIKKKQPPPQLRRRSATRFTLARLVHGIRVDVEQWLADFGNIIEDTDFDDLVKAEVSKLKRDEPRLTLDERTAIDDETKQALP